MQGNAFDVVVLVSALLAIRSGYRSGVGEAVWPALRWGLTASLGAMIAVKLGSHVAEASRMSEAMGSYILYLLILMLVMLVTNGLQKRLGAALTNNVPPGMVDHITGGVLGFLTAAGAVMIVIALLNPWDTGTIDWNPMHVRTDDAIGELGRAVVGSIRKLVVDESLTGHVALEHLHELLLPTL